MIGYIAVLRTNEDLGLPQQVLLYLRHHCYRQTLYQMVCHHHSEHLGDGGDDVYSFANDMRREVEKMRS